MRWLRSQLLNCCGWMWRILNTFSRVYRVTAGELEPMSCMRADGSMRRTRCRRKSLEMFSRKNSWISRYDSGSFFCGHVRRMQSAGA